MHEFKKNPAFRRWTTRLLPWLRSAFSVQKPTNISSIYFKDWKQKVKTDLLMWLDKQITEINQLTLAQLNPSQNQKLTLKSFHSVSET